MNNRPIRPTQCCTQFKSPGVKILCVLYLQYNVAFTDLNDMEIPETKPFIPKGFELGTTLKPRANGFNIVGQQLPTLLDITCCVRLHTLFHVVGCCCVLLRKV